MAMKNKEHNIITCFTTEIVYSGESRRTKNRKKTVYIFIYSQGRNHQK